jgi:Resolvase, N terminal domain
VVETTGRAMGSSSASLERPKAPTAAERPRAYSYVRFSTPEQAKGASYERQIEMAQAYARERGLQLAETTYKDLGVSAFRHKNAETGALRAFLKAVEDGDIPAGSYLLVESLDRLTREAILEAQSLFGLIISAGITIITLLDRKEYSKAGINSAPTDLILAIVLMMRGRMRTTGSESAQQSALRTGGHSPECCPHGSRTIQRLRVSQQSLRGLRQYKRSSRWPTRA